MGNCLRHGSSKTTVDDGDDDWSAPSVSETIRKSSDAEEESLLGDKSKKVASSSTEVKIRITKKQLEELLGRVELKALSIEQVLTELINSSDKSHEQQPWRPVLQSIQEVSGVCEGRELEASN